MLLLLASALRAATPAEPARGPEIAAVAALALATGGYGSAPRGGLLALLPSTGHLRVGFEGGRSVHSLEDPAASLAGFLPTEGALAGQVAATDLALLLLLDPGRGTAPRGAPFAGLALGAALARASYDVPTAEGRERLASTQVLPEGALEAGWRWQGAGRWTVWVGGRVRAALALDRSEGPGADGVGPWVTGGPMVAVGVLP